MKKADKLQQTAFFVYILESPSARDLYDKRSEADLLAKALELDGIPYRVHTAVSKEMFLKAIRQGLLEAMKEFDPFAPALHISGHGAASGIVLTDGTNISWEELREILLPVNQALNSGLLLCMSCCEGFRGSMMAMTRKTEHPFFALVGHAGKPNWSDTAVAYAAFYHLVGKDYAIDDAVKGMNAAAGDSNFAEISAADAQKVFLKHLNTINMCSVRDKLANNMHAEELKK